MKKRMLLFAAIAVTLIYSLSCRRQVEAVNNHDQSLIEKAQSWFVKFESTAKLQDQFKQINYLWNKAQVVTLSGKNQVIAVPIVERKPNTSYRGIRFLYLFPWKNGKGFYSEVQEVLPDLDYAVYNKKIAVKTFSGYVARWDLEKGFSYGLKYKQGVAVSGANFKIVPVDSVNITIRLKQSGRILDPVTVIGYIHRADPFFYQVYVVPFQTDYNYFYNPCEYTNCNPVDMNQYYTDELLQSILNAFLANLYTAMENQNVKDSANDPCITSVLATLQSISQSLPAVVNGTFGTNATFDYTILSRYLGTELDAASGFRTNDPTAYLVALNTYFKTRTDLETASSILHESMHVQMMAWYNGANLNNNTALADSLAKNYGFLLKDVTMNETQQHELMANHYLDCMSTALQLFANARNIPADAQYCRDIAWGGLLDSKAFLALSAADQARIKNRVNAETDPKGSTVNINKLDAKGQGCN